MREHYQISIFDRHSERLLVTASIEIDEEERRQVFQIPPDEWHGYECEVTEKQRAWLSEALPGLRIEWEECEAFVGMVAHLS